MTAVGCQPVTARVLEGYDGAITAECESSMLVVGEYRCETGGGK